MLTEKQIKKLRKETPGCENKIHFNNAGASLMPLPVVNVMKKYLDLESSIGGYEASDLKEKEIQEFYTVVADYINCKASNIAFCFNATDAFARALSSIPFEEEDLILTSQNDYISNQIAFLSLQKRFGVRVYRIPDYQHGGVNVEIAKRLITRLKPKLVAITHVPTNSGLVQDVEAIGQFCESYDCWYLVDACQSVGQLNVDVQAIKCDFLSATFRKFLRGPRGAGFLYVSDKALNEGLEPLFIDMRGANWIEPDVYQAQNGARRFEQWEFPYALLLGAKVSVEYAAAIGIDNIESRVKMLADYLRIESNNIPGVRVLDQGNRKCGIVTIWLEEWEPEALKKILNEHNINCSISLKEYNIPDFESKKVNWAIRLSPHYYNTKKEIDTLVTTLSEIVQNEVVSL